MDKRFQNTEVLLRRILTELYIELENIAIELMIDTANKMWPKSPAMLSRRINEVKTNLRAKGIVIEEAFVDTAKGVRGIRVCKIATVSTVATGISNHSGEKITKDIEETVDTVGTAGTLHTQGTQPTAKKSQREGIYWSGGKWYCQYCKNSGDRFLMEDHHCSESKVKTENKKESDLGDWT